MINKLSFTLIALLLAAGCASQKVKLEASAIKDSERLVYGKIVDLNPDSRDKLLWK